MDDSDQVTLLRNNATNINLIEQVHLLITHALARVQVREHSVGSVPRNGTARQNDLSGRGRQDVSSYQKAQSAEAPGHDVCARLPLPLTLRQSLPLHPGNVAISDTEVGFRLLNPGLCGQQSFKIMSRDLRAYLDQLGDDAPTLLSDRSHHSHQPGAEPERDHYLQ